MDSQILEDTGLHGLVGSCDSILEQDLLKENINKTIQMSGPRIRKPNEESPENNQDQNGSEKGVRGRRRGLYTPKKITQQINTTTPTPQPIKPVIAPKPKNLVKPRTPETFLMTIQINNFYFNRSLHHTNETRCPTNSRFMVGF